jgi:hypothetical protein
MSRGPGKLQRQLLGLILEHGRPMTFEDIRTAIRADITAAEPDAERRSTLEWWVQRPVFERSLRRALHSMVVNHIWLIALGDGGRAEPHRYFIHPARIYIERDQALKQALQAALDADPDPGAKEAQRREEAKFIRGFERAQAALREEAVLEGT